MGEVEGVGLISKWVELLLSGDGVLVKGVELEEERPVLVEFVVQWVELALAWIAVIGMQVEVQV